jgi:hypothetical protein
MSRLRHDALRLKETAVARLHFLATQAHRYLFLVGLHIFDRVISTRFALQGRSTPVELFMCGAESVDDDGKYIFIAAHAVSSG